MNKISERDLIEFTKELSILLESNIPIVKALEILKVENKKMTRIIEDMITNLNKGNFLSSSLEEHPKIFSDFYINIIKLGEETGSLDFVLLNLANYLNKKYLVKNKIKKSLIYPTILSISMILVVSFMMLSIFPMFNDLYENNSVDLPRSTLLLIMLSTIIIDHKLVIFSVVIIVVMIMIYLTRSKRRPVYIDYRKLKNPFYRTINLNNYIVQISLLLDLLLKSGISLVESLELIINTLENKYLKSQLQISLRKIKDGNYLSDSLKETGVFPERYINTLKVGEEIGDLEKALRLILDSYEYKIDSQLELLNIMIEPVLIIIMSIIIGFIVVSLVSPAVNLVNII